MEEITVKGHRRGLWILAIVNLVLVTYNGWNWSQGHISSSTKTLTIVPAVFLVLKGFILISPIYLRLSGGRFQLRLGHGLTLSTPVENVADLHYFDGKIWVQFQDLGKVEASKHWLAMMQQSFSNRGRHFDFPLGQESEGFRSLRKAVVREPA
ncbi:MAG: hypothetical protein HY293_21650 [Planctomycetes bacterium]|nr:hypothetical protein [Planctomycetota bacterium]